MFATSFPLVWVGLIAIGVLTVLRAVWRISGFVKRYCLQPRSTLQRYRKAGSWAVVTGGGDGIGRAWCMELARRGFNVCAIDIAEAKAAEVAEAARDLGVEGKSVRFDFSTTGDAYEGLFAQLDQLEIGILVNNVGISYVYAMDMDEAAAGVNARMLTVNCEATLRMTEYVVRRMKAKRCGGAIIGMSSMLCRTPTPMFAVYCATKAFVKDLYGALSVELQAHGIDVLAVSPGLVVSHMTRLRPQHPDPSFDAPMPSAVVNQTLNQLGTASLTWGHRNHALVGSFIQALPSRVMGVLWLTILKDAQRDGIRRLAAESNDARQFVVNH